MYILNPGDGHDVTVFERQKDALIALEGAFSADHNFAALYHRDEESPAGTFRRYERGNWFTVDSGGIQNKVIDAARASLRGQSST